MRMKLRTTLVALFVLALVLSAVAQIGRPPLGQRGGRGLPPGRPGPDVVEETRRALNLSENQVWKLRELLDARALADQRAQDNIQAKLDAIAALQAKSSPDSSEVAKASNSLRDAEQARQEINEKFRADFRSLLTDQQKKSVEELNEASARINALNRLGVMDNGRGAPPPFPPPFPLGPRGRRGPGRIGFAPAPDTNPVTAEKVALGKRLFFDKAL